MRNWFKKAISMAVAVVMLLSLCTPALAVSSYEDVPEDKYYMEYLEALTKAGIVQEAGALFDPDNACTRAVFVTWLWRAAGSPAATAACTLSDVEDGQEYTEAVAWAQENGIVKGYYDGAFGVNNTVTRAQMVTFLYRWAQYMGKGNVDQRADLSGYPDAVDIPSHAEESLAWAVATGVMLGTSDGKLDPNGLATRAHAVAFQGRTLEAIHEHTYDNGVVTTSATCTKTGVRTYTCSGCGAAVTETIAKKGHNWGEWTDNGDGTHTRVCSRSSSHTQTADHGVADGVCTDCEAAVAPAQEQVLTREDLEDALMETAWAYYFKGDQVQYGSQELNTTNGSDSGNFTNQIRKFYGGAWRSTLYATLEDATSDNTIYTVCSDYMWNVYKNTLDYSIFGHRLAAITAGFWMFSEREGMLIKRYHTDDYQPGEMDLKYGYKDTSYNLSLDEMKEFLRNWEENLRPGDVLLAKGHTQLYVGNGYFLDATGGKYNMTTGKETFETKGTIQEELHTVVGSLVDGTEQDGTRVVDTKEYFSVIRPLNVLCIDDGDGDPSNDLLDSEYVQPQWEDMKYPEDMKTSGFDIIDSAADRVKYPGIEIDRTVAGTHMGTAVKGGTLTYNVVITNNSNVADYCTWKSTYTGTTYTGEDYTGLRVTETAPEGTELVADSVVGGTVDGDTITWNVDIPAGESVTLSYTVTVTAELGETIVNDGGFVGNTPSNSISNTVGGEKLAAEKVAALTTFAEADRNTWNAKNEDGGYNISVTATDTVFAERIYERVLGLDLELPSVSDLMNNLFEQTLIEEESGWSYLGQTAMDPVYMYTLKDTVSADYQLYQDMMVTGYLGGKYVKTDAYAREPRINEFSAEYLEPGDIIIHANMTDYSETGDDRGIKSSMVLVYLGDGKYAAMRSDGTLRAYSGDNVIWEAFSYDFFICLRPSQAYANVNTSLPAYDMSNEPAPDPNAGNLSGDTMADYYTAPLNDANKALIADYVIPEGDGFNANIFFANQFYETVLGIDVGLNYSFSNLTKTGVLFADGTMISEPNSSYEKVYWMLEEQKYYGGSKLTGGNTNVTLENLEVGDVLACYNSSAGSDESKYWVGVYQGNGKFAYADYLGNTKKNFGTTEEYTDETLAEFIGKTTWSYWLILRPSEAFANINAQPLSDANKAAIAGLDHNSFESTSTNAPYAWSAYQAIGLDFVRDDVGNGTYAATIKKIFDDDTSGEGGVHVYTLKKEPDKADRAAYLMLVHGYFGGPSVATKGAVESPTLSDLEIGDIVLLGMRTPIYGGLPADAGTCYTTAVYQGNNTFIMSHNYYVSYDEEGTPTWVKKSVSEKKTFASDEEFVALLEQPHWQAWFVLRPSQAYDNINNINGDEDAGSGDEGSSGGDTGSEAVVEPAGAALSAANQAKVVAYTAEDIWEKAAGNLSFANQFYTKILGMKVSMDVTVNTLKGALFADDGTMVSEVVKDYENLYWMLEEHKYYGGSDLSGGNSVQLSDLAVGDVLACSNNSAGDIKYWVGVYQGNGKFAYANTDMNSDKSFGVKEFKEDFPDYLSDTEWKFWFVLQPSEAFDDINTLAT